MSAAHDVEMQMEDGLASVSSRIGDQTKPQIDLFVNYGTIGLAGAPRTETNFFAASSFEPGLSPATT